MSGKTGAYGSIAAPTVIGGKPLPLPILATLKNGTLVQVVQVPSAPDAATVSRLQTLLNYEIRAGDTYPFETEMDEVEFRSYFLSASAFMVADAKDPSIILGTFYVKPNYPGRCSHICNGGFLTAPEYRGQGVGKIMAKAFLVVAPLLGYKASVFNLVFESNVASVELWRGLGFKEIGRVPKAGRLHGSDKLVDAIVFHYDFEN
ncbi:UNVERIFIED_CONTAM: hypothetical protein HDU68_006738 [Siphonaria sp. JEL0065]|nr:hypothetical protein HDU68_006738 [Siphonaria sp. JEL0065]